MSYYSRPANTKLPTLSVELWIADNDAFTLNDPTLGRLNAGNYLEGNSSQFENVACEVMACSWRRGATSSTDFLGVNPGYATVKLYDPDRVFDPANTLSPKVNKLRVGMPLRISASWAGTDYVQYTGFVWSLEWENDVATFTAGDLFTRLARAELPSSALFPGGQVASQRIADIMTAVNYATQISLALPGAGRPMFQTLGTTQALEAIDRTVVSDFGLLTLKPDGTVTYATAWYEGLRSLWFSLDDDLCDGLASATLPGIAYDRVRNDINATSTNSLISTRVSDTDSIDYYGRATWNYQTVLQSSTDLTWWANLALLFYKQIPNRVPLNVVLDPQASADIAAALWPALLTDGIGQVIDLNTEGLVAQALAVGVTHNYDAASDSWQVYVTCAAHPLNYAVNVFRLNGGTLGYLDYSNTLKA